MEHGIGFPFHWILNALGIQYVGFIFIAFFALIGFGIGTFKIPNAEAFKVTRTVGGEKIDDIILRYIRFKRKKNKIYITKEEEI